MEAKMNLVDYPHTRVNLLTGERVLVSPHRTKRPWQGKVEAIPPANRPAHDPSCYLCPGNERAGGLKNPAYEGTFVFTNDFAALLPEAPVETLDEKGLLLAATETGTSRVICFSPRHDLTIGQMENRDILGVVKAWQENYADLGSKSDIGYVQIFENRGDIMGCSNPHPHGQIWATRTVPDIPARETERQADWLARKGRPLLMDYLELELVKKDRIIFQNDEWVALVPFWAVWPYETMVLPKRQVIRITDMDAAQSEGLADALGRMARRFDQVFQVSFPYSMGIHQAPTDGKEHPEWQTHLHFLPPLLRSATVRKFMVGYEMLAMPQRDITPEASAARLRECSEEKL